MSDKFKEIGAVLAAARRQQNKSLKDAADGTKIMEQYLTALETGRPEELPSLAYFQLFARSYAQFLGIDPMVFEQIEEKDAVLPEITDGKAAPASDRDKIETASQVQTKKFVRSLLYIIGAVILIFVVFVLYNLFFVKSDHGFGLRNDHEGSSSENVFADRDSIEQAKLVIPETPYEPPGKLKLRLVAKQEVWAVVTMDGDTVLNRRLDPGNQRQWEADYRFNLTLGISTAVDIFVNDEKLAPLTDRARTVAGLEINQANYKDFYPSPDEPTDTLPPAVSTPEVVRQSPAPPPADIRDSVTVSGEDTVNGN
jgi:transcriptional regulator with XRE-family HTH domain